jgi:hypothetical protein
LKIPSGNQRGLRGKTREPGKQDDGETIPMTMNMGRFHDCGFLLMQFACMTFDRKDRVPLQKKSAQSKKQNPTT